MDLLVVNPNSSSCMTDEIARNIGESDAFRAFAVGLTLKVQYMTGPPTAPPQIDGLESSRQSCEECLPILTEPDSEYYYGRFDGILVACFSDHPLVEALNALPGAPLVLGLLNSCLSFVSLFPRGPFSIITSNAEWVEILDHSVEDKFLTGEVIQKGLWKGTVSTNLQVLELHSESNFQSIVQVIRENNVERLKSRFVILGCAGFSGLQYRLNKIFQEQEVVFIDPIMLGFQALLANASFVKSQST